MRTNFDPIQKQLLTSMLTRDHQSPFEELEEKEALNKSKEESSPSQPQKSGCSEKQQSEQWKPAFPDDSDKWGTQDNGGSEAVSITSDSNDISINYDDLELDDGDLLDSQLDGNKQFQESLEALWKKVRGKGEIMSTQPEENSYLDRLDRERVLQRKIVALSFVKRGYGVSHLKAELKAGSFVHSSIDESKYKSLAGSLVREAFRKLQSFLLRDCKVKLQSLSGYEMKLLQTLLLNCRNTLPSNCVQTFLKIISIANFLEDTSVTQTDCVDLYNQMYQALRKKVNILRGYENQKDSMEEEPQQRRYRNGLCGRIDFNFITPKVENAIILQYIHEQSLSRVRDKVRREFRISENKLNVKVVRNVIRRILRATIRNIQTIMNEKMRKERGGDDVKYTDENIKHVLQAGTGASLRSKLCRLHLVDCKDSGLLLSVYKQIMSLLAERGWTQFRR